MTIAKGRGWGEPAALPAGGVIVRTDAEAGDAVRRARTAETPIPVLGILGGDLCRTLGGRGEETRLRSADAVTFPIDLGTVEVDGAPRTFVSHVVIRNRTWTRAVVAMNASWIGTWNVAPRAHPNDGRLDVYEAHLSAGDLLAVRRRLPLGAHLPHPRIRERRAATVEITLDRPRQLWIDGRRSGHAAGLIRFSVLPDALRVVV